MPRSGTTFQPGQSGNPGGRPKRDVSLSGILKRYLRVKEEDGRPRNVVLAERLWELTEAAIEPDTRLAAIKYIYDRADGKPVESQQVSGPGGAPIGLQVFDHRAVLASLAAGPEGDYPPSGSDESAGDGEALG